MNWVFKSTLLFNGFPIKEAIIEFDDAKLAISNTQHAEAIFKFHRDKNTFYKSFLKKI